jgi:hypothetical protein
MKLLRWALTAAALASAAAVVPASAAAADRLPDLAMAPLSDFRVEQGSGGRNLLKYTATIVNIGAGRFQTEGSRSSGADPEMSVVQRIFSDTGGSRLRATAARMYFAGDGHNHWHVRDLEESSLNRLDNGVKVGSGAKHGFCFSDNTPFRLTLAGAPPSAFYTTCGSDPTVLTQMMGLSVGWGDIYHYYTVDQWVDITDLTPGRYRLTATADAQNWFAESNDANNSTWTDLQITKAKGKPKVTGQAPSV